MRLKLRGYGRKPQIRRPLAGDGDELQPRQAEVQGAEELAQEPLHAIPCYGVADPARGCDANALRCAIFFQNK